MNSDVQPSLQPGLARPHRLENTIQKYAWGSKTALADLLGHATPTPEPEAELWMGAHSKAPSRIDGRPLNELLAAAGEPELSYLFKVLAVGAPLSIQAHPNPEQAVAGFAREEAAGVPLDAAHRNYRDANAKPELIYALTPFTLMRGFRSPDAILGLIDDLNLTGVFGESLGALRGADPLRSFFDVWMALPSEQLAAILAAVPRTATAVEAKLVVNWIHRLAAAYPGDRGALSPLFLHIWQLTPGEVVFTGPGVLHAYLDGLGIEHMVNSDNVLRGGLTPKHVDVDELRTTLVFKPSPPDMVEPVIEGPASHFRAAGLELSALELSGDQPFQGEANGPEILLCVAGEGQLKTNETNLPFEKGASFFVPATTRYELVGDGRLFRAAEGLLSE